MLHKTILLSTLLLELALEAGLSVRNYGFYCDEERYFLEKNDSAYTLLKFISVAL